MRHILKTLLGLAATLVIVLAMLGDVERTDPLVLRQPDGKLYAKHHSLQVAVRGVMLAPRQGDVTLAGGPCPDGSGRGGCYVVRDETIWIDSARYKNPRVLEWVLRHELGHHIDYSGLDDETRGLVRSILRDDRDWSDGDSSGKGVAPLQEWWADLYATCGMYPWEAQKGKIDIPGYGGLVVTAKDYGRLCRHLKKSRLLA